MDLEKKRIAHSAIRIRRSAFGDTRTAFRIPRSARRSAGKKLMLCTARRAPIARAGLDRDETDLKLRGLTYVYPPAHSSTMAHAVMTSMMAKIDELK